MELSSVNSLGYFVGQPARTAVVNNVLSAVAGATAIDASNYKSAMVQVVSTATGGSFIFEGSNDNVNFQTIPVYNQNVLVGSPITSAITPTVSQFGYIFPVNFRYIRLRISGLITGGSIQAFSKFMQTPFAPAVNQIAQNTAGNLVTNASIIAGQAAHSAASAGTPVRIGGRVNTTLDTTLVQGDACDAFMTTAGQQVQKPYGTAENDWQYAAAAGGITNSTADVVIKAAGAANIRNYLTSLSFSSDPLLAATEIVVKEGATIIWRHKIQTSGLPVTHVEFPTPLKSAAATALNVAVLTSNAGAVYFNAQGYQSF